MKRQNASFIAALVAALAAALALPGDLHADGFIVVRDPPMPRPGHFAFAPLEVRYHHVAVEITDLAAVTTVDQEFFNPNDAVLEGTYLFPLPSGAVIDRLDMEIEGKMSSAELLPADKARAIYEEIVRKARDPALLEYAGRDAFKLRIFPIEARAGKRIRLRYTQLLKSDSGLTEYLYPLSHREVQLRTAPRRFDQREHPKQGGAEKPLLSYPRRGDSTRGRAPGRGGLGGA